MKKLLLILFLLSNICISNAQLNREQQSIKKVFFDFLKYYKTNEKKFNSFKLYKGRGKENNPPFKIQWKEAEKYFAYLRSSVPYVGETYIKAERERFKYSDSCFKADPDEELPMGFDYDRWAGGQESITYTYKWYTEKNNTYEVTLIGDSATLKIGSAIEKDSKDKTRYWSMVPFKKEKGKWVMADNIYPADEEN